MLFRKGYLKVVIATGSCSVYVRLHYHLLIFRGRHPGTGNKHALQDGCVCWRQRVSHRLELPTSCRSCRSSWLRPHRKCRLPRHPTVQSTETHQLSPTFSDGPFPDQFFVDSSALHPSSQLETIGPRQEMHQQPSHST